MKKVLCSVVAAFVILLILTSGNSGTTGKAGNTGSPGEATCNQSGCHNSFADNTGGGSIALTSSNMTGWGYQPGVVYHMSLTVNRTGSTVFGIGLEALDPTNADAGTLTPGSGTSLLAAPNGRMNLVHTFNGGLANNTRTFNFDWTAPSSNVGNVTFWFTGVAGNNNGGVNLDYVYTGTPVVVVPTDCLGVPNGSAVPGSSCNDNDACTINDVYQANCTCSGSFQDSDNDGTCNANDGCPNDPNKVAPGICGCGVPDTDSDSDGTPNCNDGCPNDPNKISPGICGCGVADTDNDNDGTPNCNDGCPNDANKIAPGQCGCGSAEPSTVCNDNNACTINDVIQANCACSGTFQDTDGDGTCNANDGCPNDPAKIAPGQCGCNAPEPGTACDDGNANTTGDAIDPNCTCIGHQATDCLGQEGGPAQPGTPCDDSNNCTVEDHWNSGCQCVGSFLDSDGDGVCNANDDCPNVAGQQGTACNDQNSCTVNDVLNGACQCAGSILDSDGDGTCNANDGCPFDPYKITAGTCGCGVPDADTDSDGLADCIDSCPFRTGQQGSPCDDGNPSTSGDVLNASCVCVGSAIPCPDDGDPCTSELVVNMVCTHPELPDTDGDGTCDLQDGCPNDPNKLVAGDCGCNQPEPGTSCDDNDPCTTNDVIRPGCMCAGDPADPLQIIGPASLDLFTSSSATYTVEPSQGALDYTWMLPNGWSSGNIHSNDLTADISSNSGGLVGLCVVVNNNGCPSTACSSVLMQNYSGLDHCIPYSPNGTPFGDFIDGVEFGDIHNTQSGAGPAYTDYTTQHSTQVDPGETLALSITSGSYTEDHYTAWIDFDLSGTFDPAEKIAEFETSLPFETQVFLLTIPLDAAPGHTVLRVRGYDAVAQGTPDLLPCDDFGYGEVEDYDVHIVNGICVPSSGNGTTAGDFIDGVEVGAISNLGSGSTGGGTYTDYTGQFFTAVEINTTTAITITSGDYASDHYTVWIDLDHDNRFEDFERCGSFTSTSPHESQTLYFSLPGSALLGMTKLRVRGYDASFAGTEDLPSCDYYEYGETEDYQITLILPAFCDDNDPCTTDAFNGTGCINTDLVDSDNDGTCDQRDGCPGDPSKLAPGTCGCGVPEMDSDGDGVYDCIDNCPNFPGGMGGSCDDGDPCTMYDVITSSCTCSGTFVDSDLDGICDVNDDCPFLFGTVGSTCNVPNVCYINGIIDANCQCTGTFLDTDGDLLCDPLDNCPLVSGQIGSPCDDNNTGTVDDVLNFICQCIGQTVPCADSDPCTIDLYDGSTCIHSPGPDADGDGACDLIDDCPLDPFKTSPGTCGCGNLEPGSNCDDQDNCTINDVISLNCSCNGSLNTADPDGDGVPTCLDDCPFVTGLQGDGCNDGITCTIDDVLNALCQCVGTENTSDMDSDGLADCIDNCPDVPGQVGTGCDDNDPNTSGDVLNDVCVCVGSTTPCPDDGDSCTYEVVIDGQCVHPSLPDSDGDGSCDLVDGCPNDPDKTAPGMCGCDHKEPGTLCNDNDPCTLNDAIDMNCGCTGTSIAISTISGPPTIDLQEGGIATFSITPVPGATYDWVLPYGWVSQSMSSASVTVDVTAGALGNLPLCINISLGDCELNSCTSVDVVNTLPVCVPTSSNGTSLGDFIDGVALGDIENTGSGGVSGPSYSSYSLLSTSLARGSTNVLTITGGTSVPDRYAAWIDYDQNGTFATSEKIGEYNSSSAYEAHPVAFTVPMNAAFGHTVLRVRGVHIELGEPDPLNPCFSYGRSETEDYDVQIQSQVGVADALRPGSDRLSIWPNPTSGRFILSFNGLSHGQAIISIFDATGRQVKSSSVLAQLPQDEMDLRILAPGTYLLVADFDGERHIERVVIQQ